MPKDCWELAQDNARLCLRVMQVEVVVVVVYCSCSYHSN